MRDATPPLLRASGRPGSAAPGKGSPSQLRVLESSREGSRAQGPAADAGPLRVVMGEAGRAEAAGSGPARAPGVQRRQVAPRWPAPPPGAPLHRAHPLTPGGLGLRSGGLHHAGPAGSEPGAPWTSPLRAGPSRTSSRPVRDPPGRPRFPTCSGLTRELVVGGARPCEPPGPRLPAWTSASEGDRHLGNNFLDSSLSTPRHCLL